MTGGAAPGDGNRGDPPLAPLVTDPPVPASLHIPADAYDGLICDLDGVVHRGARPLPGAVPALEELRRRGHAVVYATNNAMVPPERVAERLTVFGITTDALSVVTSAQAGAARMATLVAPGAAVAAVGGEGLLRALEEVGLRPVPPAHPEVDGVLQGYGQQLTVSDFAAATRHVLSGVPWVATNDDRSIPLEWGAAPGNGAYVGLVRDASGREPVVVGKPHPDLYELAAHRLAGRSVLAVGDRLDTDIAGAEAAGLDAAWVLTGVHRPCDLLRHPEIAPPRFLLAGLSALTEPYAAVLARADGWVCGDAVARVEGRGTTAILHLDGDLTGIEVVRAGLRALLEAQRTGVAPSETVIELAQHLDRLAADLGSRYSGGATDG